AHELPLQSIVRVQRECSAAAFVTRVGRARGESLRQRLVHAGRTTSGEAASACPHKTAVPALHRNGDPDANLVSAGWMGGEEGYSAVAAIHGRGLDSGVR